MKKQTKSKKAGSPRKAAATAKVAKTPRTKERDPRLPAAGTTLTRVYKGRELTIAVLEDGFKFEGETFSSLSSLASKATGQESINGFLWVGLTKRPAAPKPESAKETPAPAKKRAPKSRRAGRDPQAAATESAVEAAPAAEAATA